tara:strand:+ start:1069 stop:1476 length:408 start_codon:yes stop_codon:yes gene_type:complete
VELLGRLFGHKAKVTGIAGTATLTASDSAQVFAVTTTGGYVITLPLSATAGVSYLFINSVTGGNVDITQANAADDFVGTVLDGVGGSDSATGTDTLCRLAGAGTGLAGDWVRLTSDGTNWLVEGTSAAANGILFA